MKYNELVDKVATLPRMDRASVPYLVTRALDGQPTTSTLTLLAHCDGSYTATHGDLRTQIIPVTDSQGRELRFPDEDAACAWAWDYLQKARGSVPTYDAEQTARNKASGEEIRRRWEELERSQTDDTNSAPNH